MSHELCFTFKSPGPPWYAANCRLPAGHPGEHDLGTKEEANRNSTEIPSP